jgi:hypothetical protein
LYHPFLHETIIHADDHAEKQASESFGDGIKICNRRVDFCGPSVAEHQKFVLITGMPGILGVVQLED